MEKNRHDEKMNIHSSSSDVIIIGAGFSGISALYHLRKLGLHCQIVEKGRDIGGVWYWNRYPGARTDSGVPSYILNLPECWETWDWSEPFPDHNEINAFLDHCDKTIGIRRHVVFGKCVTGAQFNTLSGRWAVVLDDGTSMTSKYLICAVGTASQRTECMDDMLNNFRGQIYLPCLGPNHEVNPERDSVAVIGTGSTGLQVIQELGPCAKSMTVYQRSYNAPIPLPSETFEWLDHQTPKERLPELLESRKSTPSGIAIIAPQNKETFEVSERERQDTFKSTFRQGLSYWLGGFKDLKSSRKANRASYDFWAKNTRPRIHDHRKRNILAPLSPRYPFGAKRPGLDYGYFELFNRENVDVIDTSANPISTITEEGIVLEDGTLNQHDIIIPAVGYNSVNNIIRSLGLHNTEGTSLDELWIDEIRTFLGIMHFGLPNLFMVAGPQSPGEQSNVPACIDIQVPWIADRIRAMENEDIAFIRPKRSSMDQWHRKVYEVYNKEFYAAADGRYTSAGLPLFYGGGLGQYWRELEDAAKTWDDFEVVKRVTGSSTWAQNVQCADTKGQAAFRPRGPEGHDNSISSQEAFPKSPMAV